MFPFENILDFGVELSDEVELFRKTIRQFAENDIGPRTQEMEKTNRIPDELFDRARELGLFGIGIPPEYDGQGGGPLMLTVMMEELSRVSPAFATAVAVSGLFTVPVMLFGDEGQKRKYLPPVARGERFAAHANTEPIAGSDVAGIQSTAKRDGDHWIVNAQKIFITGADKADYFVVSARTSSSQNRKERWKGLSFFIVEKDWPGVRIGQKFEVIGLRGEQPNEVILEDVKVPEENLLGREGDGFKIAVTTYDYGRVGIAGQAVGIAQAAFEKAFNYAIQRRAFERPIISFEAVSFKLADILMKLEAARLMTYWAATLQEKGRDEAVVAASLAKTFATEVAEWASAASIKIHGGVGLDREVGVEGLLRDSLVTTIYEGTNDIQRITIIRQLMRKLFGSAVGMI